MHPKVLIIGTTPYNTRNTARAFDAYFHYWEKENLAQIFSNPRRPCRGHCGTLYQITDLQMVQRWRGKKIEAGVIFQYDELESEGVEAKPEKETRAGHAAYKFGRRHTALTHLMRGVLWRKRFWQTEKLDRWMDEFQPECVFLAFSDDYFIPQIAMYAAERYRIPIVSCIGDDYYFNGRVTVNPFFHLYKCTYRHLIDRVFDCPGSAIYISDKIQKKYNGAFGLDGETVYLSSTIERKAFRPIETENPVITYFGNIRMGRNHSLDDIGEALGQIRADYCLEIYSNEQDRRYYECFKRNANVRYMGSVPYAQVQKRMGESDITVIVEGFAEKDIRLSRYSLSTKAADALASGVCILAYGSAECGIIEYMKATGAAIVCTEKEELAGKIQELIGNTERQRELYGRAQHVSKQNHNREVSCRTTESVIRKAIEKNSRGTDENE